MKKLIDLPSNVIANLEKEAKEERRKLKAHIEYVLITHSNGIAIIESLKEKK